MALVMLCKELLGTSKLVRGGIEIESLSGGDISRTRLPMDGDVKGSTMFKDCVITKEHDSSSLKIMDMLIKVGIIAVINFLFLNMRVRSQ